MKITFLELGNIIHECPVLRIHPKFHANLSKLQGRSDRGNLQKTLPWFCDYDVQRSAICTRLCECCKPAGAEVISNSSNNIPQTWCTRLKPIPVMCRPLIKLPDMTPHSKAGERPNKWDESE